MIEFTGGEWKIDMQSCVSYECVHTFIYPEDLQVRQCDDDIHIALVNHAYPEWQANARLIAAAPEMYRLLESIVSLLSVHSYSQGEAVKIHQLLARIDGEEAKHEGTD